MSGISKKLMGTTAVGGFTAIEDVFSTYLYTGNGSTQTITNGIDLAGEGGMVWIKNRVVASNHALYDTVRGAGNYLSTNLTNAQDTTSVGSGLTAFNSDGFSIGTSWVDENTNGQNVSSWTFLNASRFFQCITYTGNGAASQTISHSLGSAVGHMVVKPTSTTGMWRAYHRTLGATNAVFWNSTTSVSTNADNWNNTEPTSTNFTVGINSNASGATYVAYLFAHDPLGPSGDGSDGLIACGSFTTDGSGFIDVDLGWEPQLVLWKPTSTTGDWFLWDTMRGMSLTNQRGLRPNLSSGEASYTGGYIYPKPNGFASSSNFLGAGVTAVYIAIRRGPMRQPTSGTEVFDVVQQAGGGFVNTGNVVDMLMETYNLSSYNYMAAIPRLTGRYMETASTAAEAGVSYHLFDYNNGVEDNYVGSGSTALYYAFKRAPSFFDVTSYVGTGVARTVPHNLGVAPEFILIKNRGVVVNWIVYHAGAGTDKFLSLNTDGSATTSTVVWQNTAPTSTEFYLGTGSGLNDSANNYIAYLFASCPGVSKVGSYTGNGTSQTINCGFTTGARFILIKRTDSTGDWYVWDTERGIVAGNDPHMSLNTTAAEVTTDDSVDPDSSGFIVNQVGATNINVSSASYIYLAIA